MNAATRSMNAAPLPMNPAYQTMPSFGTLHTHDFIFRGAARALVVGVLFAVGILWASQPVPGQPVVSDAFGPESVREIMWLGVAAAAIGAFFLIWRYLWVRKVLSQGLTVKGKVEKMEMTSRDASDSPTHGIHRPQIRTHFATLRYAVNGQEYTACLRVPSFPSLYGIVQGGELDLAVLESSPKSPLLRSVYQGKGLKR